MHQSGDGEGGEKGEIDNRDSNEQEGKSDGGPAGENKK